MTASLDAKTVKAGLTENDIVAVYSALGVRELKRGGPDYFTCPSPLRNDSGENTSFKIDRRTGHWHDHATGEKGDIFDAVKARNAIEFPDALKFVAEIAGVPPTTTASMSNGASKPQRSRVIATYVYCDAKDQPYMAVDRDENKQFLQKRPNGRGGWIYGLDGLAPIPYRLNDFPKDTRRWLIHCEGEKDADRAIERGSHAATTSPGGSKNWRDSLKVHYAGLNVAIVADNDEPGWKYAQEVAQSLHGVANRVKVISLPGLGPRLPKGGKDLSDWYDAGNTVIQFDEIIDSTPDWSPEDVTEPEPIEERQPRFRLLTPAELASRPSPNFLVEGMLVEDTTSALIGAPGTMKSILALDFSLCISSGLSWHDHQVMPGPVVYVSAEGSSGLPARIRAWEVHHGVTASEQCYILAEAVQMMERGEVDELLFAITRLPETPILVIYDTLARNMVGGNDSASLDMGLFIAGMDAVRKATGAHQMVVHHENKSGDPRGSTALRGALDTEIAVKREDSVVTLICNKQKDAAEFDRITLVQRVIDVGLGQSSIVLEPMEYTSGTMSGIERKALGVLIDVFGEAGTTTTNWKKACEEAGGITHASFYRARRRLEERGLVANDGAKRGAIYTPVGTELEVQSELE